MPITIGIGLSLTKIDTHAGADVPANAMLWPDGSPMLWPDGSTMLWPS